ERARLKLFETINDVRDERIFTLVLLRYLIHIAQTLLQPLALLSEIGEARALRHEIERVGCERADEEQRGDGERDDLWQAERARCVNNSASKMPVRAISPIMCTMSVGVLPTTVNSRSACVCPLT